MTKGHVIQQQKTTFCEQKTVLLSKATDTVAVKLETYTKTQNKKLVYQFTAYFFTNMFTKHCVSYPMN